MKFVCPKCGNENEGSAWDESVKEGIEDGWNWSIESYRKNVTIYRCPSCGKLVYGSDIEDMYGWK